MIDINKQYTLVGNRNVKVKLSHIDGNIVYGYYHTDDDWQSCKWNLVDGVCIGEVVRSRFHDSSYNLVPAKTKIKKDIWISIYPNGVMLVRDNNFLETYKQILPLDTVYMQVEFNV
jgi:hypothetical protein